jgi:hypothetical protein
MLGRLRMDVDCCINAYCQLSEAVFHKVHHRIKTLSGKVQGRFDSAVLEASIKSVLTEQGYDPESLLKDLDSPCKV